MISTVDYTAKADLHISVSTAFRYDFHLFGPDYLESKMVVTAQGTLTFAAGKAYEHEWEIDHEGVTETLEFIMQDKPRDILWDFALAPIDEERFPNERFRTKMSDYDLDRLLRRRK